MRNVLKIARISGVKRQGFNYGRGGYIAILNVVGPVLRRHPAEIAGNHGNSPRGRYKVADLRQIYLDPVFFLERDMRVLEQFLKRVYRICRGRPRITVPLRLVVPLWPTRRPGGPLVAFCAGRESSPPARPCPEESDHACFR